MRIIYRKISAMLVFLPCLLTGFVMAEEKVNFSDESVIREILFDNRWICGVGDDGGDW